MAEKAHKDQQYQYAGISNLVLQADRSSTSRRDHEPTGEPETLWGKIGKGQFGDRAASTIAETKIRLDKKRKMDAEKSKSAGQSGTNGERLSRKNLISEKDSLAKGYGYTGILAATEDFDGQTYRPCTKETRQTFELILAFLSGFLGDIQQDVLRSAADAVLETLKNDLLKDFDKLKEIEALLSATIPESQFSQLINLGKKITDYGKSFSNAEVNDDNAREMDIDDGHGVAVVFEENEDEDGSDDEFVVEDANADEDDAGDETDLNSRLKATGTVDRDDNASANGDDLDDFTTIVRSGTTAMHANSRSNGVNTSATAKHTSQEKLDPHKVDAFWLQRAIVQHYSDALTAQSKTAAAMEILSSDANARDIENDLMGLFDYEKFDLVRTLTRNRNVIVWCTRLAKADLAEEKENIKQEMRDKDLEYILDELNSAPSRKTDVGGLVTAADKRNEDRAFAEMNIDDDEQNANGMDDVQVNPTPASAPRATVDLEALAFQQGGHLMSNNRCKLPEGSFKRTKKGYEEVHVPAPLAQPMGQDEQLIKIADLPEWVKPAFGTNVSLNRIQSRIYPTAFEKDENFLLCAPTGAGKTNCAMLTILREIGKYRDKTTGTISLDSFKIVYVAPMKALVAEMVGNFGSRLKSYGVNVAELTGDRQLTKQQISETQIIVTTPEKWDIITRKATDRSYTNLVRLIIIDEIHLLHDERGPVLEAIVARTLRQVQQSQDPVRLVGLSATLPNYADVATFLRVDPASGVFFFDNSFRPCPLKQQYVGITEKKAIKRLALMNEIAYEKVLEAAEKDDQVLIFCHSRKETAKTAKIIRDMAIANDTIGSILKDDRARREILQSESENCANEDLKDVLPYGFAIHHAGMTRLDRSLVEDLFRDKNVRILVSTATLAWGVNLPAHTVIIKGTQVYRPDLGRWAELSPQDMLQMLGRAGRPSFDTFGEGVIITTHTELQYYLSLLNQQLPIESQLVSRLPDILNAEIVMGNVRSRQDAVDWLGYTYLYIRMLRNGGIYGVTLEDAENDPYLIQKRIDLIHAASMILDKCNLIKYDKKTGRFQSTELGRIASYFYISHYSMSTYNQHLKPSMSLVDLFRVFALSNEFKLIPVREEEKLEVAKMIERVPVPVKESLDEPTAKINVLLQSYISQLRLDGFALMSDMVYVTQSAGRIMRAIFEICLRRGWAALARKALDICKMVDKRIWLSMSPLRQFRGFPIEAIKRLERKDFSWDRYHDLTPQELAELAGMPKAGKSIHKYVHQLPKLIMQAHVQPITRSMLKFELTITPDFQFDEKTHGAAESFWILVEDVDAEQILYHDVFVLKQRYSEEDHIVSFTVPLFEPLPPNYFVSIISDRWLHHETRLPVSFKHLILPEKNPLHTELMDLQPLPVSALKNKAYEAIYANIDTFNPTQTQVFNSLYQSDDNVFVGAPAGSGKTVCAEFALLRLWAKSPKARCIYIGSFEEVIDNKLAEWRTKFSGLLNGKNIVSLTGETAADLKLLETGDVIFSTPQKWDMLSRRWKQRKNVQTVGLFIVDDIHLIGSDIGPAIEVIVSRMRYVSVQTENKIRIVALGASLSNALDLGEWMGASAHTIFNFHPSVRPVPLEIHIQGYNIPHFPSLMLAMTKPTYLAISSLAETKPAIIFVPSRKQSRMTAVELLTLCLADGDRKKFLHCSDEDIQPYLQRINDPALVQTIEYGVAFYHEALGKSDKAIVESLFDLGAIQVVVASRDTCWSLRLQSRLVVIMGTQYFEGKEHRYVDYPITDVLQMMGRASRPLADEVGLCVLMCQNVKKEFYKKFLHEALPVESHLDYFLHDHFNAEIVTKTIESKQDAVDYLTWTFLYRRMALNPNYYNLQGTTHRHLSDHLSELVESTLEELANSKCITVDDDEVAPLNLGMIAAYYYINYVTIEAFSLSLKPKTKLRGILEIVSASAEFENVPIRHHEDSILKRIYDRLPVKAETPNFLDPHFKTNILLQAHFSRLQLPPDLESDQKFILERIVRLIQACIDVISSNGWLTPALSAMELSQMSIQALWERDSPLQQIPHVDAAALKRLAAASVEQVFDVMEMEDEDRNTALQVTNRQMGDIARFVNRYPNIDVQFQVDASKASQGDSVSVRVILERETDEDDDEGAGDVGPVIAPFYPQKKDEGWWVVVGDATDRTLLAIKRTTLQKRAQVKLDFTVPETALGNMTLKIYVMCDAYMGVDQEFDFSLDVTEAEDEEEKENSSGDDKMEE
ncbi:hypothetical protein BATDEDRAFT_34385 [Batrachochytrium dendrobatidis JAM81]|uniref:RNA helicase n=2 Tax=Batrachochytrium dendrobatidis TaxID=109871 RepID=F4NVU1_BATDJ|nr:ATP-dependent RNA helicase BRR2 [Batrachochytrium dendrobatidis JAM81]EGF82711.1 hypothetical protein BATDEDRAFT_34385 [Batrachochytrium dendrobatidis JAM81]OAJ39830.1 hypothetical protein BDEG_23638 [Batrachochytrium dendrobatidis JEL423]|eukprot:XP_006676782.1 hypothetical protein BATDEDRAFT_34385 [Batrachochytrium dendrobatidis JAM81]